MAQIKKLKAKVSKKYSKIQLSIFALLFIAIGGYFIVNSFAATVPTCTSTVSVGANLASAVSGAPANAVVCLNDGNYGSVNLFDISRSSFVTVRSTNGTGATISPQVGNSDYVKFQSLTISGAFVNSCSTHIHFLYSTFTQGMSFNNHEAACGVANLDYLIDNSTFNNLGTATYEGRLNILRSSGVVISNSTFSGIGAVASDGIQLLDGTSNTIIGPGNKFTGILESLCGSTHCDALQLYGAGTNNTITGNYFEKGDTFIMAPDDSDTTTVTNNVFDGSGSTYDGKIQFGGATSPVFKHNTVRNLTVHFTAKVDHCDSSGAAVTGPHTTNAQVMDNIFGTNAGINTLISNCNPRPSACDNCNFSSNMFATSGSSTGLNNLIGTAVFSGGSAPTTYAGYALAAGSPGKGAASDGKDIGVDLSVTPVPPVRVGDTNNDGLVNIVDLSTLLSHYNTNYTNADFNKDNIVNITDLSVLLTNFGK